MNKKNDYWNLTNRFHTKLKLEIYEKYLESFLSIFESQQWYEEVFIVDGFAGRGTYDCDGKVDAIDGTPIIAAKLARKYQQKFFNRTSKNKSNFKVKCFFVDIDKNNTDRLNKYLISFSDVEISIINGDFNKGIAEIIKKTDKKPTLFLIDPYGTKSLKKESVQAIVKKIGPKDIFLNYIHEGVSRIHGLAKKCVKKDEISQAELKTITNLTDFFGHNNWFGKSNQDILKMYVEEIIKGNNNNVYEKQKLDVRIFNMPYSHKSDTIYCLIFASRNKNARKIIEAVYAKAKTKDIKGQQTSMFSTTETANLYNNFKL